MGKRNVTDYLYLLQSLLPKGSAWTKESSSVLGQVLYAIAEEFAELERVALSLLNERDTRFTSDLLTDHEFDLGLPDECSLVSDTIAQRRNNARAKLIALGGANKQYFIDIAAALGYTITIQEYPDASLPSIFHWQVTALYDEDLYLRWFTSGSGVSGDPICQIIGIDTLICFIEKYKPAHTVVVFILEGPEFDQAFDISFKSLYPEQDTSGSFDRGFNVSFDVYYGGAFEFMAFDNSFNKQG